MGVLLSQLNTISWKKLTSLFDFSKKRLTQEPASIRRGGLVAAEVIHYWRQNRTAGNRKTSWSAKTAR